MSLVKSAEYNIKRDSFNYAALISFTNKQNLPSEICSKISEFTLGPDVAKKNLLWFAPNHMQNKSSAILEYAPMYMFANRVHDLAFAPIARTLAHKLEQNRKVKNANTLD